MLDHIAFYTKDVERLTEFYLKYFGGHIMLSSDRPEHRSRFISYGDNTTSVEIMQVPVMPENPSLPGGEMLGLTHISMAVDTPEQVVSLTERLEKDGYKVIVRPTDYGTKDFFESCILDPDGNRVEIGVPTPVLRAYYSARVENKQ